MFGRRWASVTPVFAVWPAPLALVRPLLAAFWGDWVCWIGSAAGWWQRSLWLAVQFSESVQEKTAWVRHLFLSPSMTKRPRADSASALCNFLLHIYLHSWELWFIFLNDKCRTPPPAGMETSSHAGTEHTCSLAVSCSVCGVFNCNFLAPTQVMWGNTTVGRCDRYSALMSFWCVWAFKHLHYVCEVSQFTPAITNSGRHHREEH